MLSLVFKVEMLLSLGVIANAEVGKILNEAFLPFVGLGVPTPLHPWAA